MHVLIVAAGSGKRFGSDIPKVFHKICGKTILEITIDLFLKLFSTNKIMVVVDKNYLDLYQSIFSKKNLLPPVIGGKERYESVKNGLEALLKYTPDKVLIHDGARPFIDIETIERVINSLTHNSAVIPVIPETDTVKYTENNYVSKTIERNKLFKAQTPQGFDFGLIYNLYQKNKEPITDDSQLVEINGGKIVMVEGNPKNIKITYQDDLPQQRDFLVGFGYDVHKFDINRADNNFIMLGGVKVKHPYTIIAHSDGDVLLHALVDAILGAAGKGDIGNYFPPSNPEFKDMDSRFFVKKSLELITEEGLRINNVDCLIICEKPAIEPCRELIRESIAHILEINSKRVNIKATTTEGLGFTGRREGIAAKVVVSLVG